jgi:hypothetical protein
MKFYGKLALAAASLAAASGVAFAATLADDQAVTQALNAAGYAEVRDIEMDDGLYEAEVRRADGRWGEVTVDAATGEIFDGADPRPMLTADQVRAQLIAGGYASVEDIEREGAIFEAEGVKADGTREDLRVSAFDARVLAVEVDSD